MANVILIGITGEGDAGLHPVAVAALLRHVVRSGEVEEALRAGCAGGIEAINIRTKQERTVLNLSRETAYGVGGIG